MDDEEVERILASMEYEYGEDNMELMAKYGRFRQVAVRGYLYGSESERNAKAKEGKRSTFTWKQYTPISKGIKDEYGK